MQVALDIPDAIAAQLTAAGKDPARTALEAFAIEGYRTEQFTESEVRQMLGYATRMEVHALLAEHEVPLQYTEEHARMDIEATDALFAQRTAQMAR